MKRNGVGGCHGPICIFNGCCNEIIPQKTGLQAPVINNYRCSNNYTSTWDFANSTAEFKARCIYAYLVCIVLKCITFYAAKNAKRIVTLIKMNISTVVLFHV